MEANLVALQALLEDMDCEVVSARSGNEALRYLLRREFAVVLLDVQMPEMDGYEVAHHARRNPSTRDVPIIFLTAANNSEGMVLRGYGSGAVDFLFKPLNPSILRGKVRVFLELHAAHRKVEDAKTALELSNAELRSLASEKARLADQFQSANIELQQAYTDLQTTHAQLVQSAKMASLGELVAGVAHEINNPLAFVLSHLDTARRKLGQLEPELPAPLSDSAREKWQRANERLNEIGPGLERIRELVIKLRTFSRLDEGELKRVSIRECVESVLTILGHRLRGKIEVVTDFGLPDQVDCYASLLNQAIMNLVSNSIDAMPESGVLRVVTGLSGGLYSDRHHRLWLRHPGGPARAGARTVFHDQARRTGYRSRPLDHLLDRAQTPGDARAVGAARRRHIDSDPLSDQPRRNRKCQLKNKGSCSSTTSRKCSWHWKTYSATPSPC